MPDSSESPHAHVEALLTDDQRRLVEENLGLVHFVVRRHFPRLADSEDAVQDGVTGLMQAAVHYDPARSAFSTYAVRWIHQAVFRGFARAMGRSFRAAKYRGDEFEAPVSLEGLDVPFTPHEPGPDLCERVVEHVLADETVASILAACADDVDRAAAVRLIAEVETGDGPSFDALAAVAGVSRPTVQKRYRALQAAVRATWETAA